MAAAVAVSSTTALRPRASPSGRLATRRATIASASSGEASRRSSIRRRADDADEPDDAADATASGPPASAPTRRAMLTSAAAAASAMMPFARDVAAIAAGEPPMYPDVVTMQEAFWEKTSKAAHPERWYPYWWALHLAPYGGKATAMSVAHPNEVWCFDQLQGLLDVLVNVRMTVVRLNGGGLWVHNPIAPTAELMSMLAPIVDEHGPVKHIVVGSAAIEHKIYSGPFSKKFPSADVWIPPKNWTFPVDVPIDAYVPYYPRGSPKTLPEDSASGVGSVPWGDQIEHSVIEVGGSSLRNFKDPWFVDTAFYLKKTKTLLITDVVMKVNPDPVPVATINPEPLLVRGMEGPDKMLPNTREARSMGWGKTILFGLLFQPASVDVKVSPASVNKDLLDNFTWDERWKASFQNLVDKDIFVPPILHVLAFPRRRDEVKRWAEGVAAWDFNTIIPSHLDGPIDAGPKEFAAAIDAALTTDPRAFFGEDIEPLLAVDKLSRDLKSLEEPRPLTDATPIKYFVKPAPAPAEEASAVEVA